MIAGSFWWQKASGNGIDAFDVVHCTARASRFPFTPFGLFAFRDRMFDYLWDLLVAEGLKPS